MNTQIRKSIDWHMVRFAHQQMMFLEAADSGYDAYAARYAAKAYFERRDAFDKAYPSRWKFDANWQPSDVLPVSHPDVRAGLLAEKGKPETWQQFVTRLTGEAPAETPPKQEPEPYVTPARVSRPAASGPVFEAFKRRFAPEHVKEGA